MADELNKPEPVPAPTSSRPVWELVIEDMRERDRVGRAKYGTPLQAGNGRDAMVDAYQEALDLAVYFRQAIAERDLATPRVAACTREDAAKACCDLMDGQGGWASAYIERKEFWRKVADAVAKAAGFAWREVPKSAGFPVGSGSIDTFKEAPPAPTEELPAVWTDGLRPVIATAPSGVARCRIWWYFAYGEWSGALTWSVASPWSAAERFTVEQWRKLPAAIDRQAPGIKRHEPLPRVVKDIEGDFCIAQTSPAKPQGWVSWMGCGGLYFKDGKWVRGEQANNAFAFVSDISPGELMPADAAAAIRRDFPDLAAHPNIAPDLPPEPKYVAWTRETCPLKFGDKVRRKRSGMPMVFIAANASGAICTVDEDGVNGPSSFDRLLANAEMPDGKPCGRVEGG